MTSSAIAYLMKEENPFIYLAAHDLRAPLMSIKGLINLMKQDTDGKNRDEYFKLLEKSVEKVDESINEIITYSKNGNSEISPSPVELKNILKESIQILHYMEGAEAVKIELITEEDGLFFSDQNLLFSIFSNIISNAIRYHDTSKESSYLLIKLNYHKEHASIKFEDNGIGIDPAMQNKIFDKFFLANHEHNGTGLGLYAVKNSIEKLGGNINVESVVGEGTRFSLHIPNLLSRVNHF